VFGSASMGALRAAELASFGMEGVGAIFEAYRDGLLKDDDEVAVTHAPAEAGFAVQSEAMVNIRATLAAAEATGVLRPPSRVTLERIAKDLFYPDRTYPLILRHAAEQGEPADVACEQRVELLLRERRAREGRVFRPWISAPGDWLLCDWRAAGKVPTPAGPRPLSFFTSVLGFSRHRQLTFSCSERSDAVVDAMGYSPPTPKAKMAKAQFIMMNWLNTSGPEDTVSRMAPMSELLPAPLTPVTAVKTPRGILCLIHV